MSNNKFGIDISHWQGNIDLAQAKAEGVEYVIVKVGGADDGYYSDSKFEQYYKTLRELKMPTGAYYFADAYTQDEAIKQAKHFVNLIGNKDFELPLFIDIEAGMLNASGLTDLALAFCNTVKEVRPDIEVGVYTSVSHFNGKFDVKKMADNGLKMWVACYSDEKPMLKDDVNIDIWQYGGSVNFLRDTHVAGIVVDQNLCYMDIPEFKQHEEAPQPKPIPQPSVPTNTLKYSIGDVIEFTKIHSTSADNIELKPLYTTGTITNILSNANNPYLINNGMGWVRECDIVVENIEIPNEEPIDVVVDNSIKVGDTIKVKQGAMDQNFFITFADVVYQTEYKVIAVDSKYVVFGTKDTVVGKILLEDAIKSSEVVQTNDIPFDASLKVGDRVKLIDNVNTAGVRLIPRDSYTIYEVSDDGTCVIDVNGVVIARVYQDNVQRI